MTIYDDTHIKVYSNDFGVPVSMELESDRNLEACSNNIIQFKHLSHGVFLVTSTATFQQSAHADVVRLAILEKMPDIELIKGNVQNPNGYFWGI